MKTAISIPDEVFARAESFARSRKLTRSALFTLAVEEYVQGHRMEGVTERLNAVYAAEESTVDPVIERLQAIALGREEW